MGRGAGSRCRRLRFLVWSAIPALITLVIDAASKRWAVNALAAGQRRHLFGGTVTLQLAINHGVAFGIGSAHPALAVLAASAGLVVVLVWTLRITRPLPAVAAGLMLGGGAGNLLNRLGSGSRLTGHGVVDWIHLSWYAPTFNLADVALRIGLLVAGLAYLAQRDGSLTAGPRGAVAPAPLRLRRRSAPGGVAVRVAEVMDSVDQAHVGECLREVTEEPSSDGVVLLGE